MSRIARFFSLLLLLSLIGCPTTRPRGDDDDDSGADDDDATGDDDDVAGDDDDSTAGDDDDSTVGDDDDSTAGDDDDSVGDCNIELTLMGGDTTACGSPWTEQGVELSFRSGSCAANCAAEATSSGVWVYPAELFGDLSNLDCSPSQVTVEIVDWTSPGSMDVVLYDGSGTQIASGTNGGTGTTELVQLSASGVAGFGVSGCESQVVSVRID